MNGRIYDPSLGRFLQADPHIQAPTNSQNYNRYSYVLNNPMSYTDPSGYFFKKLYKGFLKATGIYAVQKFLIKNPMLSAIAQIVVGYYGGPWAAAGFSYDQSFVATGSLNAAFKSGAISYAAAWGAGQVGANYGAGTWENIAGNALVGGIASDLQGGNFGHGFWAAGVTAYAKGANGDFGLGTSADMKGARVITAAVVGGTASVISGGKFANGAITGAFSQMFNGERTIAERRNAIKAALAEARSAVEYFAEDPYNTYSGDDVGAYIKWTPDGYKVMWPNVNAAEGLTQEAGVFGGCIHCDVSRREFSALAIATSLDTTLGDITSNARYYENLSYKIGGAVYVMAGSSSHVVRFSDFRNLDYVPNFNKPYSYHVYKNANGF